MSALSLTSERSCSARAPSRRAPRARARPGDRDAGAEREARSLPERGLPLSVAAAVRRWHTVLVRPAQSRILLGPSSTHGSGMEADHPRRSPWAAQNSIVSRRLLVPRCPATDFEQVCGAAQAALRISLSLSFPHHSPAIYRVPGVEISTRGGSVMR